MNGPGPPWNPATSIDWRSWWRAFGTARAGGRGAADLTDIAKAAIAGRVDTLLIEAERVIPGRVDASGALAFDVGLDADVDDVLDDLESSC